MDGDPPGADTGIEASEKTDGLSPRGKGTKVKSGVKQGAQAGSRRKPKDHANYCKLKIKNKNSKAKGRGFGRRR